jgi:glucose/arabinose dehydrogenase
MKALLIGLLLISTSAITAQTRLTPQRVTLKNGKTFSLNVPSGYEIIPAAEGLKRVRFFAKAPDGRLFVTDMYNLTDNKRGVIYVLDGWDERSGKFAKVIPYMSGLHNPNSVQFYRDPSGQDWLYIAETEKLTRRKFTGGEEKPTDTNPQPIATFPDYGLSYKYGGWHLTRTIAFSPAGKLYVSVGSSCNSCEEKEKIRATVLEMDPDGKNSRVFAKGLRNAVSIKFIGDKLWATNQGSDHLGTAKPDETFYALKSNADYGWPYCHSSNGRIFPDPKIKRRTACRNVTRPDIFFLVSLHGSTNKAIGHGYKIVSVQKGRRSRDLITGFLQRGNVVGRPCDILKLGPDSFLFTDDHTGIVYLVRKRS